MLANRSAAHAGPTSPGSSFAFWHQPKGYFSAIGGIALTVALLSIALICQELRADTFSLGTAYCSEGGGVIVRKCCGIEYCRVAFSDGGQRCNDGAQCSRACIIPQVRFDEPPPGEPARGVCQPFNEPSTCSWTLAKGRVTGVTSPFWLFCDHAAYRL